jgi:hypothetical protein
VRGFFGTETALNEAKAQFLADAIIPAIDKKHAQALAIELPRKGSKEFNEMSEANRAKWEDANKAKKDARAVAHTMFARVVKYAFPSEKPEGEGATLTLKTKLAKMLTDAIGKCEKAEEPDFDVLAVHGFLKSALAEVSK